MYLECPDCKKVSSPTKTNKDFKHVITLILEGIIELNCLCGHLYVKEDIKEEPTVTRFDLLDFED
jgi:hypothetical protein